MTDEKRFAPRVDGQLRHNILRMPETVYDATGIVINGRCIKSFVFTTDLAIIRNCDADAVFAVYPFTPQQAISDALIKASYIPVFCGVGGGTTHGLRTVGLAKDVECQGAMGVVLNAPITNLNLRAVALAVDIPVIITVTKEDADIAGRLQNGASILNVACAAQTPQVVRKTINMDYRSLFLHFECGVLLQNNSQVTVLRDDVRDTLLKCREVQVSDCHTGLLGTVLDSVLRLLSPLM